MVDIFPVIADQFAVWAFSTTQKGDTILVLKALISVLEPSLNKAYPVVSTQTICKRSTVMHSPSCWNPKPKSTCRLLNSTGGPNLNKASVAVAIQSREESHKGHHFLPFPCLSKPTPSLKKKKGDWTSSWMQLQQGTPHLHRSFVNSLKAWNIAGQFMWIKWPT